MNFAQQYPRPFTLAGIGELDHGQSGVYGISADSTWIYVGKGNIRERLLAHLKGDRNLSTTMGHSTGLIREQCPVW